MLAYPANLRLVKTDARGGAMGMGTKMSPRNRSVPLVESQCHDVSIPQTRAALSTIASSTGWTSVGDRLMMPSTSAVAV